MHQGSALHPLLFVIVMEALSTEFRIALTLELLYADDLVVMLRLKMIELKGLMSGRMTWRIEA